jgi:hypothetical protein
MSAGVAKTPRTRIAEAKDRFTIPVLWRRYDLPGKPAKSCRAPFRKDRSPSFSVSEDGLRWIDFATGERGDAIDFLAKIKGISNAEAFVELLKMVDHTVTPVVTAARQSAKSEERRPDLSGIEPCSYRDLSEISKLRFITLEGLKLASERRVLFAYDDPFQGACWLITDDARRCANYRRMDGRRFHFREATPDQKEGPKSRCLKSSQANWPIGIAQASAFPAIALCEGGPDFLSAFALAYAGAVESLVEPVCMSGAACRIHEDALPMFRGKRVRIFGHADETGQEAMRRWAQQLRSVEAEVDGFNFSGLFKRDGSPVKDLNDFLLVDRAASQCAPELLRGIMDFALERWKA